MNTQTMNTRSMNAPTLRTEAIRARRRKSLRRHLVAIATTAALASTPLLAAEVDETPRHIGAGSGALAGAVIAGPVGAILGSAFGTLIGHQHVQQNSLEQQQQEYQRLSQRLDETYDQLATADQTLADRRGELAAAEQQFNQLRQEHASLKEMVGGLKLSVYFAQNSSHVDPRYQELLKSLSEGAAKVKGLSVDLEGHSNKSGPADYNLQLSKSRGEQVGNALQQHGMPPFRLLKRSKGAAEVTSTNPYSPEDRRVDLQFRFDDQGEELFSIR